MRTQETSISRKELADALDIDTETATTFLVSLGIAPREPLNSKNIDKMRFGCHPLIFDMSRELLGKLYVIDTGTLSKRLKKIGITHSGKLSPGDLERIYCRFGAPHLAKQLGVDQNFHTKESVRQFFQGIGKPKSEKWYKFYFGRLGVPTVAKPFDFLEFSLRTSQSS